MQWNFPAAGHRQAMFDAAHEGTAAAGVVEKMFGKQKARVSRSKPEFRGVDVPFGIRELLMLQDGFDFHVTSGDQDFVP
jgi:hypothetical protein